MNRTPLTDDEAKQIGGALHRLQEIGSSKIISPTHEAEQKGLLAFLSRILVEHCDELLASWIAVHNEYEPLIGSFAALLSRATGVIQRSQNQRAQQQKAAQKPTDVTTQADTTPENVVPLR